MVATYLAHTPHTRRGHRRLTGPTLRTLSSGLLLPCISRSAVLTIMLILSSIRSSCTIPAPLFPSNALSLFDTLSLLPNTLTFVSLL